MRKQLLLVVALAVLGTAVTAGAVNAALLGLGGDSQDVNLGDTVLDPIGSLPECSNLRDDDGDGRLDLADAGCSGPLDNDESNDPAPPPPPPDDGGTGGGGDIIGGVGPGGDEGHGGGGSQDGGGGGGDGAGGGGDQHSRQPMREPATRNPDGSPTNANPTLTVADFGPAPIGVPSFIIDQFTIPPFLLPLYQACGTQYGIPWEILASINRIETAFGTNLNVSSAGAVGWMQFLPSTWKSYGVDANGDGRKDPYNPYDAICAAGRYLKAAGGEDDLRGAIFAYNHADWYVDEVILYAHQYGDLPEDLIGSITGLTEGARFPVAAEARYADDLSEREAARRAAPGKGASGNVADIISGSPTRRGINIYSHEGAPVVAVNDGVIKEIGHDPEKGNYIVLQDAYGNRFTYAKLDRVSEVYPVPKQHKLTAEDFELVTPKRDQAPEQPATAGAERADAQKSESGDTLANTEDSRPRLYALPERPHNVDRAGLTGQLDDLLADKFPGYETVKAYLDGVLRFDRETMEMQPLDEGSRVVAGTVLGRIGKVDALAPRVSFAIKPSGRGAPKIDPKPILDGWKLLEATAIYRAADENPFKSTSISEVLLMSKTELERRVIADPRVEMYECGRQDVQTGQIDRRVLALLEYLSGRGFRLTVTSLKCGHSTYTTSGYVSEHSSGSAVDIAQINGIPVLGNQGKGSITEALVEEVLQLQGSMAPHQVISLMDLGGPSFAMGDHADHVHVGYSPVGGQGKVSKQFAAILKPDQWEDLIGRIAKIENPNVPTSPSRYSLPARKRASDAHIGE